MVTITSRPDSSQKEQPTKNTKYAPIQITDEEVEDMARHLYTQEAIARRFKISVPTLMTDWGEAYHRGATNTLTTPKAIRLRMVQDFLEWQDYVDPVTDRKNKWTDKDAPRNDFLALLDKMESKYEAKPKPEVEEMKGGIFIVPMVKGDDAV